MAEIKVIIKIDESKFEALKSELYNTFPKEMKEWGLEVIRNGTQLCEENWNECKTEEEPNSSEIDKFDEEVFSVRDIYYRLMNAGATGVEIGTFLHLINKYYRD